VTGTHLSTKYLKTHDLPTSVLGNRVFLDKKRLTDVFMTTMGAQLYEKNRFGSLDHNSSSKWRINSRWPPETNVP
jgi:hypothetical protein